MLIQGLIFEGLTDKPTNGACHALQDHLFHCNKKVLLNVVYIGGGSVGSIYANNLHSKSAIV